MDFAERVKNVRIELKLSQEDLAHKLGVGFATINKWENDSYSKHLFFSIEKAERLNARQLWFHDGVIPVFLCSKVHGKK